MASLQCHKRINKKSWHIASAAAASSGTYGFSVGVRADLATTKQESSLKQTSSNKSSLNAKRININSTKDISITGSDLASKEDMSLNSNNLNINSSEDTLKYKSHTKSLTTGFGFTFYGGNSKSLDLGLNDTKESEQSLTNNNSHLYSAKDMNINTANDATIKGANLRADERLNLKVGNNLSLESTRDIRDASSKSKGINLSVSYSGATNAKHFASGDSSLSSVGASISKSNSNTKIKQTNLSSITANELNVEVGKNTHLKGSLLAAGEYDKDNTFIDNHNLNLKTNTLSYENLSNTSYNKGSSLSIGANYQVGKKDDSKANQNGQDKSGSSYSGLKSINYSNQRNLSYTLSKNLATLGKGNIEIVDKDNSDDLDRLNKDTTKLTKDLVNTSISSNLDGSMDARVFSKEGRKEIAKEYKDLNKNMNIIASTLPDKNSDNVIEKVFGNIFEGLNYISLGIMPSKENRGGILANIPVLTGIFDNSNRQYLVVNKESDKYSEKDFEKIQDSKFFKSLSDADREKFKDQQDLYISKNPYEITKKTATFQNFTNGMMNNEAEAIKNGLQQTGFWNTKSGKVELTINYNPSYGFLGDLLESAVDKFGGTTGIAKQTGNFYNDVVGARGDKGSNFANHSQANGLAKSGIKWKVNNGGFNVNNGKHTIVSFGSPISREEMSKTIDLANSKTGNEQFVYSGSYTKKGDFVGEALGGNSEDNKDASLNDRLNILNAIKLFTDDSPHSEYICESYVGADKEGGVICGYR